MIGCFGLLVGLWIGKLFDRFVSRQFEHPQSYKKRSERVRPDIGSKVNGIPLFLMHCYSSNNLQNIYFLSREIKTSASLLPLID